jgi:Flp pilus assembly protein TadG
MSRLAAEEGSTLVETPIVLTTFLGLFLGIVMICQALYAYDFTAEAARLGARYAIVRGSACTSFATACPASAADIQTYVRGLGFPGIVTSNINVTTTWPTTGSTCTPSSSPCNNPGNQVQVKVQYTDNLNIPFLRALNLTFSSTSKMVISQ